MSIEFGVSKIIRLKHKRENKIMAECNLCNKKIGFGEYTFKIVDGTICENCMTILLGGVSQGDLYKFRDQINEIEKMTIDQVVPMFEEKRVEIIRKEAEKKEAIRKESEMSEEEKEFLDRKNRVIVTTADLHRDYDVIGPVYIQVNNRSGMLRDLKSSGQGSNDKRTGMELMEILFMNSGAYNGHADFDSAFFIAVEELKERATLLGADAVIGMRQDIDLDSVGYQYFYLQMYGTAVKFKDTSSDISQAR